MYKILLPLFLACALPAANAVHFDPPDLSVEETLHAQYIRSLEPKIPNDDFQAGLLESYQVQQGENLWNLSQMLYGDGNYWPKVWAQNQSITNPHLVRKGHVLQFLMGSEDETPAFRFSEEGEGGLELAAAVTSNPQIEVPPPEIPPRPVIKIPNSFPSWQSVFRAMPKTVIDDSRIIINRPMPPSRIPLTAYVQDGPIEPIGTFLETEKDSSLTVSNAYAYVKLKKGLGHNGMHLLVVKDRGAIKALTDQVETPIKARFIQIFAELQVADIATNTFAQKELPPDEEVFRVLVVKPTDLTLQGYDLIAGQIQVVDTSNSGQGGTVTAQVIGSNKHEASALYGAGDIVFINRGVRDGVQPGQMLDIYIDRSIRSSDTLVRYSASPSGTLKIAKVSESCATAVIVSAVDGIQQGDLAEHPVSASALPDGSKTEDLSLPPEAE